MTSLSVRTRDLASWKFFGGARARLFCLLW